MLACWISKVNYHREMLISFRLFVSHCFRLGCGCLFCQRVKASSLCFCLFHLLDIEHIYYKVIVSFQSFQCFWLYQETYRQYQICWGSFLKERCYDGSLNRYLPFLCLDFVKLLSSSLLFYDTKKISIGRIDFSIRVFGIFSQEYKLNSFSI